jgi:hypothetical protein
MKVVYYSREPDIETDYIFRFNGINLKRTESETDDIDFIVFASTRILVGVGVKKSQEIFKNEIRNHPNYHFAKKNPHLPVIFYHRFEFIFDEQYELFSKIVCEELNRTREKIILLDSCITHRNGVINIPKSIQLRQYHLKTFDINNNKEKKFSFLNNKNNKLRTQVFDKIISNYNNDIERLKSENIITFRNYLHQEIPPGPSKNISNIKKYINQSNNYKFVNDYDFFETLNIPWALDDFKLGEGYVTMHENLYDIYSKSYFSLVVETSYFYLSLEYPQNIKNNMAFSEKGVIPLHVGNLPFIVHYSEYYNELEKIGLDFSYLKSLFDIDYKNNSLIENFKSIDKFISYFRDTSLESIKKDYQSLSHIVKNNIEVLKKIENKEINTYILRFYEQIKKEKHK